MLTRLKVSGFKNLMDVDVSFGPFTCLIGPNGSGKSALLDALAFLGAVASDQTLAEAARTAAGSGARTIPGRGRQPRTTDVFRGRDAGP
jgi:predicted ATPase